MNNNIKVTVSIVMPGSTGHIVGTTKKVHLFTKKDLIPNYKGKDGDKIVRKRVIHLPEVEYVNCSKTIKLTQDAYDYMTSDERPEWSHDNWKKMNKINRLEAHLARLMLHNNGTSFSYTILED